MLTLIEKEQAEKATDFNATDSNDQPVILSDYRGQKNIILVLNRGFFCPYCRKHMAQLREDYATITATDTEVIAVGPEDKEEFSAFWTKEAMPFIGIPDPQHEVAHLYGQQVKILKVGRMPALFIIDKNGLIRARHFASSMSEIPENTEVLKIIEEINSEA